MEIVAYAAVNILGDVRKGAAAMFVAVSRAGCRYRGRLYRSGSQWVSDAQPCVHYHCLAGVLTRSVTRCVITCNDPIVLPDHCCPHCPGELLIN